MPSLDRLIRAAIERAYSKATTGSSARELAKAEVAAVLARHKFDFAGDVKRDIDSMVRNALRERDKAAGEVFHSRAGATSSEVKQLAQQARTVADQRLAKVRLKTSDDALRIINTVLERAPQNMDARRITRQALQRLGIARHHARTEVDAARAAIDNIGRLDSARVAGITTFRYNGPTANVRSFCAQHVGLVFHLDEIRRMDNGQGLPVEHYCGGYNCRHRWTPFRNDPEPHRAKIAAELDEMMDQTQPRGLPGAITGREIVDAFDPRLPGIRLEAPQMDVTPTSTTFRFRLVNDRHNLVGQMQRKFYEGDESYEVEHSLLRFFDRIHFGRGSATRVMENSIALYDRIGVTTIRVNAGLEGGHVSWAKMGFKFDDENHPGQAAEWREHLAEHLVVQQKMKPAETRPILQTLYQPHDFMNLKFKLPSGKTFSGTEWKESVYQGDWYGVIYLDSPPHREYIDTYVRTKVRRQP